MNSFISDPLSLIKQFSLRDLFDLSDALVIATDAQQRVIYVNPAFCNISGYRSSEIMGKNPRYWGSRYTSPRTRENLKAALKHNRAWAGHFVNCCKDAKLWHEKRTVQPLFDPDGEVAGYLSIGFHVHELEQNVRRLTTLESQHILMAAASHELNNMLGTISGLSEVNLVLLEQMEQKGIDGSLKDNLRAVLSSARQAEALISRLRRGGSSSEPALITLDAVSWLRGIRALLHKMLPCRITFALHLPDHPVFVAFDDAYLMFALSNLVKNAGEATRESDNAHVALTLKETPDRRYAVISISDNGCGMTKQQQQFFMEPFFTTKGDEGGTGLGMLQVQLLLDTHSGTLNVVSKPNEGTTIAMYLPLQHRTSPSTDQEEIA